MLSSSNSVSHFSFKRQLLVTLAALCLTLIVGVPTSKADIIVSFGSSTPDPLIAGSSGTVDVFIRTNAGTQTLDGFQAGINLTGGPAGGLIFSAVQAEAQLGIGGPSGYVFFSKSISQNTSAIVGIVGGGGSSYIGADSTDDGSAIPLVGNPAPITLTTTNRLLYRLNLSAVTAGNYSIDLNGAVSSFYSNQLDPVGTAVTFSSTAGTLNITAVPEPSSLLLIAFGSAGMLVFRRRVQMVA